MSAAAPTEPRTAAHPGCLYCGGRDLDALYAGVRDRLGHVPGERTFLRCRNCGSAVLDPLPRTDELPGFYPPVYTFSTNDADQTGLRKWLSRLEYAAFFGPLYRAQVRQVLRGCGWAGGAGKRMLDVGCGRGLRLLEFRRRGFAVHGLDHDPGAVEYLRARHGIPADCADVSDVTRLQALGAFDLVTAFFLLEHVPDVRGTLADMARLLRPGGWLAAAVPLVDSPQAAVLGARWSCVTEAPRHISLPTRAGFKTALREAGFDRVRLLPDAAVNGAGQIGLSVCSRGAISTAYGGGRLGPLLARGLGAAVAVGSLPWAAWEGAIGRPANGIFVARKPAGGE